MKLGEKLEYAAEKTKGAASGVATYTKESADSFSTHYKNGTLSDAAKQKANETGDYIKRSGTSIYEKVS